MSSQTSLRPIDPRRQFAAAAPASPPHGLLVQIMTNRYAAESPPASSRHLIYVPTKRCCFLSGGADRPIRGAPASWWKLAGFTASFRPTRGAPVAGKRPSKAWRADRDLPLIVALTSVLRKRR